MNMIFRSAILAFIFFLVFQSSSGQSHHRLDSMIASAENHPVDTIRVTAYSDLCYEYRFIHQDSALTFGLKGIELAKKINYPRGLAQVYSDAAHVYYDKGDFDKAISFWDASFEIRSRYNDLPRMASLHLKLGSAYYRLGDYKQSLDHQLESLRIYETLGMPQFTAQALNNVAAVYEAQNMFDKAMEYYQRSFALHSSAGNKNDMGVASINIGNIFFRMKQFSQAKQQYRSAVDLMETKATTLHYLAMAYNNLSEIYTLETRYDSAFQFCTKALECRKAIGDYQGIVSSLSMMGRIQTALGQYASAQKTLLAALDSANQKKLLEERGRIYLNLSELFRKKTDTGKALDYYILYTTVKDSLLNESGQAKIAELQVKYETEKKEQQLALKEEALLRQQEHLARVYVIVVALIVTLVLTVIIFLLLRSRLKRKQQLLERERELRSREAQIQASIQSQENERKRFAQDIHDGMGQLISALKLMLQPVTGQTSLEERVAIVERSEKLLNEMHHEIRRIAFNLMPHTLLQSGLIAALRESAYRINSAGKVQVHVSSFDIPERLKEVQEISLYRIVQEWVNNILKYAAATSIEIQIVGHEQEISVTIEDNGIGLDPMKLEDGSGNGWKNIRSRVNLIKGALDIDAAAGRRGTTLTIRMPVEAAAGSKNIAVYPS